MRRDCYESAETHPEPAHRRLHLESGVSFGGAVFHGVHDGLPGDFLLPDGEQHRLHGPGLLPVSGRDPGKFGVFAEHGLQHGLQPHHGQVRPGKGPPEPVREHPEPGQHRFKLRPDPSGHQGSGGGGLQRGGVQPQGPDAGDHDGSGKSAGYPVHGLRLFPAPPL